MKTIEKRETPRRQKRVVAKLLLAVDRAIRATEEVKQARRELTRIAAECQEPGRG